MFDEIKRIRTLDKSFLPPMSKHFNPNIVCNETLVCSTIESTECLICKCFFLFDSFLSTHALALL